MDREIERQNHAWEADVVVGGYHSVMKVVGIQDLKDRLDEFLALVLAGETVLVTDDDEVVAEFVPPRADRARRVSDAVLMEDIRNGLVTPATRTGAPPVSAGPKIPLETLLRDLREDRDAR